MQRLIHAIVRRVPPSTLRAVGRWFMGGRLRLRVFSTVNRAVRGEGLTRIAGGPLAGCVFAGGDTAGYVLGASEPAVQRELVDRLGPGRVFYDVGANIGFMSLLGSRLVGPSGTVVAFEPLADNREQFERNLGANGCENYRLMPTALSDECGTDEIVLDHGGGRAGLKGVRHGQQTVTVPVATLDSLIDELRVPDLIKIDVEGAESRVLAGMRRLLANHGPALVIELHGHQEQPVRSFLSDAGYQVSTIDIGGGMPHLLAVPGSRQSEPAALADLSAAAETPQIIS